ncbi:MULTISPECIES: DUF1295 domain-containing protein [unclassified Oceanispirochaeta]|uniref:DUF1295 domain-containing protein n=1 Tax=unclassified Oceanispirochaeta TaxID=2635722 RepID=UPI000E097C55|nr:MULTISPECIES: DUF1295 domain-containing protein [unclassified Oceanispirochaeta]MBF9015108.1 DUF2781 domain-containing protein [Oceanispirochaeta sp. M2]NPD71566.1 DUF2781 domain-containing protein [Oceanispirochaeta sp. M1]RDG33135.1 DUF2781 domain-containing protein [Oceanispirochaeta sp. M1]
MLKYIRGSKRKSLWLVTVIYILALTAGYFIFRSLPESLSLLSRTLIADCAVTILIFISSLAVNNSSMYDPYWSVIPPFLFFLWYMEGPFRGILSSRYIALFTVCTLWALRLTLNWAIDWPGLNHEDWRYKDFRMKFKKLFWPISFLAIHLFPTLIVFLASIPAYLVLTGSNRALNVFDFIAMSAGLTAVYFQLKSDGEMRIHRRSEERFNPMTKGLWSLSRHPNYFGEILFWISIFLFVVAAAPLQYWSALGAVGMVLLFTLYSIPVMEARQLNRRSGYKAVQLSISELIPMKTKIDPLPGKKLMDRRKDIFYVVIFMLFTCTSFVTDSLNGFQQILSPDSSSPVEQIIYQTYAVKADPNLIINPPVVRIGAFISAVIWGPLYIFFVICFIRGWNLIRNFGLIYGGALSSTMIIYIADGLFGVNASPSPLFFFAVNIMYFLVPFSMIIRMWRPRPFGHNH